MSIARGLRLAVVLGLLATGAACGGGSGSGGSGDKVELTLLSHYSDGPSKDGLDKMIQQWNKDNPKVQVKAQVVKFDDLLTTMTVRQTGGRGAERGRCRQTADDLGRARRRGPQDRQA